MAKKEKKAPPVMSFRLGRIKAAVWERTTDKGTFHAVTFQRSYLDETEQWQNSDSYGRDDLLLVAKLADMAHTWIVQHSGPASETAPEQAA